MQLCSLDSRFSINNVKIVKLYAVSITDNMYKLSKFFLQIRGLDK